MKKLRHVFTLTICLLGMLAANAQTAISGTVTDESGAPIYGATVQVVDKSS